MGRTAFFGCLLTLAVALGGCVSKATPKPVATAAPANKVWARADGTRMSGNPALMRQGQADLAQCRALAHIGTADQYDLMILNGCMTSRGYVERDL